jgi:hypothetical protein
MAITTVQANNRGIKFRNQVIREWVRGTMFTPYTGNDGTAIIRRMSLPGAFGGDQINVPLVRALSGTAISTGTLTGNEEAIGNYGCRLWIDWARNAVTATKAEMKRGSFDLFGQAAPLLSDWGRSLTRNEMILAFNSVPSESPPANLLTTNGQRVNGILRSAATSGNNNTWLTDNADRVLFGDARSNLVSGNYANSLNAVTAAMTGSAKIVRLAKSMAEKSNPKIEPITTDDGYERYVYFVGSNEFRDLEADPEIYQANKDARPREGASYRKNPIFMDGDLLYHGVIIRKVPEIDALCAVNNTADPVVKVAPGFFCGRNALAWVVSQEAEATRLDQTDYQFKKGAGIELSYGVGKLFYKNGSGNLIDWGVVTTYVAAADDA